MENERFLDLSIAELSADRGKYEHEADGLIETFQNKRLEEYFKIASHIKVLQENKFLTDDQANEKMTQLVSLSAEEYEEPLEILKLEQDIGVFEQYQKQKQILEEIGILQNLPESQRAGIIGINGREYPFPDLVEISRGLTKEKAEMLKNKSKVGFTKLMMVPFPMDLLKLLEIHKKLVLEKNQQGVLKSQSGKILNLDPERAYFVSPEYEWYNEDPEKSFIYYSEADDKGYSPKRDGNSKRELLESGHGWNIALVQNFHKMIDKKGLRLDGRLDEQIATSAEDFLEALKKNPEFKNEKSFAVEDWSTYAMLALAEKNIQIDYDDQICLAVGGYFQHANIGYHTPTCFCLKTNSTRGVNINFGRTDDRDKRHGIRTFVSFNF